MNRDQSKKLRAGYLGPAGTYTHAALKKYFASAVNEAGGSETVEEVPCSSLEDIFQKVSDGSLSFGVVPVENSSEGSVVDTLNCLSASNLYICGEVQLPINHALLIGPQTGEESLTKILSHQQSLGQCRDWLKTSYPDTELVAVSSNAEAARIAGLEQGVAAIAGATAAEIYGLKTVATHIQDTRDNTTRFIVINRQQTSSDSGRDKTSLILSVHDEPGALFRALEPFYRFGISLTRLESRPSRKEAWSYAFYIDLLGHSQNAIVKEAIGELKALSIDVKMLGSYPLAAVDERINSKEKDNETI